MMDAIFCMMDILLPFDWVTHSFMKFAFLAILLVTPLFGLLSTMVVSGRMAFFSDSLGHGAFTGIALGALFGFVSPTASLLGFSVLFALLITYIKNHSRASMDTVIGVFSSAAIALGLMLMSHGGGFQKFSSYLIGDILSITTDDLCSLLAVFVLVLLLWAWLFNALLVLSVNRSFAMSRGISATRTEGIFAALLAIVVAISIQWVGILLINSLLVLPAAAARNVAQNAKSYHVISVLIAMFSGITGLLAAYYLDIAAGASIVAVASICFFLTLALKKYVQN